MGVDEPMSNFAFLRAEWPELLDEALRAERLAVADPRGSCFYARRTLELALGWLFDADATLRRPYKNDLSGKIHEPTLRNLVGPALQVKMNVIRKQGNRAVHEKTPVTDKDSVPVLRELFHVTYWIARHYTRDQAQLPASALAFEPNLIPRPVPSEVRQQTRAELKALAEKLAAQDAALAAERKRSATLDAELAKLRAEIAAAKAANEARPDDHDYAEAQTRDLFIDLCWPRPVGALDAAARPRVRGHRHAQRLGHRLRRLRAVGRRRQAARGGRGQAHPAGRRASASSRPSCTPTAWSSSSASGR